VSAPDDEYLRRLRIVAGAVFVILIAIVVLADVLGRLFIDAGFRADSALFGTLLGGLLLVLGIQLPAWFRRRKEDE